MRKIAALSGVIALAALGVAIGSPTAIAKPAHALISGSGSGWSANAVNQWIADVQPQGLQVVYTSTGSAQGRKDFAYKTTDYAVSDIGYQGTDPVTGDSDTSLGRAYAYLPIVAGGTAFPYHLEVAGQLIRSIRLSGQTIAKIFTNQITNWNDSAIATDNNHVFFVGSQVIHSLPSIPIVPVVHSEGAGTTAQFTTYLNTEYASIWRSFFGHPDFTEYYPRKGAAIAQNGSDGVMNYVASSAANGAIGFDEYSYALAKNYPVAKVLNKDGYFTLPTQYNVAVALTHAQINTDKKSKDYLLQKLNNVYVAPEKQVYPLSSYSYGIIPTASGDAKMTSAKRQTLADFLSYSICRGQREMGPIGYSPLPLNLVQASFSQINKLKQADKNVVVAQQPVTSCDNPTFYSRDLTVNCLAKVAPPPPPCDQNGKGPCAATDSSRDNSNPTGCKGNGGGHAPAPSGSNNGNGNGNHNGNGNNSQHTGPPGAGNNAPGPANGSPTGGATATSSPSTHVDPNTGQLVSDGGPPGSGGGSQIAIPQSTNVADEQPLSVGVLTPILVVVLLGLIAVPPILARRLGKPRDGSAGK